ncbi:hypothetical protein E2C01_084283 [Portunus trituberculatus]|uniref:Uncharacterized protein n=1 Tax=Portunus trituberculatus TaxID=210409 RepID=A0A5B7J4E4_PORTR|nr:hypothetical protein [Portunus trituberculatus]
MHIRNILGSRAAQLNPCKAILGKAHAATTSCCPTSTSSHSLTAQTSSRHDVKTNTSYRRRTEAGGGGTVSVNCVAPETRLTHIKEQVSQLPLISTPRPYWESQVLEFESCDSSAPTNIWYLRRLL